MNTRTQPGLIYDAVSILGFGEASAESLPPPEAGEIIIRYGGWSLQDLHQNAVVRENKLMSNQDWFRTDPWVSEKLPSGMYRLRVPVPDSNKKTFAEQVEMPPEGAEPAPTVLVATAMLVYRLQTGENLLKDDFIRCKERATDDDRVVLDWRSDRLCVGSFWDDRSRDILWASSVRTS